MQNLTFDVSNISHNKKTPTHTYTNVKTPTTTQQLYHHSSQDQHDNDKTILQHANFQSYDVSLNANDDSNDTKPIGNSLPSPPSSTRKLLNADAPTPSENFHYSVGNLSPIANPNFNLDATQTHDSNNNFASSGTTIGTNTSSNSGNSEVNTNTNTKPAKGESQKVLLLV